MRKVFIVALGLAGAGAFAQFAFAKSICEELRDACYAEIGSSDNVAAKNKCAAEYDRCVAGDSSAQARNSPVATVPGLGAPMVQPYPAAGINPPATLGPTHATSAAGVRGAAGNLVKVSPPPKQTPPPPTSSSSSHASSGSSSSGSGSSSKPRNAGSSTSLKQN